MNVGDLTAVIIAISGVAGTYTAYRLSQRGQKNDEKQQVAATRLQERITAFDELESLNDRLATENGRLRDLYTEGETRGDARLAMQSRRCRAVLDETTAALATLQSVVLSEVARAAGEDATARVQKHVAEDHPEIDEPDL